MGFFKKLFGGVAKTASNITKSIAAIFTKDFDEDFFDDLTAVLLTADIGLEAAEQIIADIRTVAKKQGIKTEESLRSALAESIATILTAPDPKNPLATHQNTPDFPPKTPNSPPKNTQDLSCGSTFNMADARQIGGISTAVAREIILVVGVNGVGKTTSIGKLAGYYRGLGKSVLVVAGDTFRAAATEQLEIWAGRAGVRIVKQDQGADPASVVFDALSSAKSRGDEVVIIDTAGRLHNKTHLIEELKKIDRVIARQIGPNDGFVVNKYIVLDATTGQNALNQVEVFNDALGDGGLDGVILTKLDGTAKGGVVVAIKQKFGLPVKFVGVGERIDDLLPFDAHDFARAILGLTE